MLQTVQKGTLNMNLQIKDELIPGTKLHRSEMGNVTGLEFLSKIFFMALQKSSRIATAFTFSLIFISLRISHFVHESILHHQSN